MKTEPTSSKNVRQTNQLKSNIKGAQQKWSKITHAEFTEIDGSSKKLSKLVESRYNVKPEEAEKQVKQFMNLH